MLLSVCTNLYANANQHNLPHTLHEVLSQIELNDSDAHQMNHEYGLTYLQAPLQKENDLVFASDSEVAEDEKILLVKKDLTNSSYFSTVLYAEQLGCWCNNVKKRVIHSSLFLPVPTIKLNVLLGVYLI